MISVMTATGGASMTNFEICPQCQGNGTVDGFGSFTRSDVDEWFGGDYEDEERFRKDYMGGAFDRTCPTCSGKRVVSEEEMEMAEARWEMDQEMEAERRMGC